MEDLNKHQLILLTLLISFVTSIATGIITYTLLQEAPVEVTNTINRVVEKTIAQVTPSDNGKTIVKEVQVVNEEDLVLSSIEKNTKSIVRLKTRGSDGAEIITGIGFVISDSGNVVFDSRSYNPVAANYVIFADGRSFSVDKVFSDPDTNLTFIKLTMNGHKPEEQVFAPTTLGNSALLKLGQSIIEISGRESNSVNIGRVSEIKLTEDGKTIKKVISNIKVAGATIGSPFLNLSGEIIGLELPIAEGDTSYTFIPVNSLKNSISKGIKELAK